VNNLKHTLSLGLALSMSLIANVSVAVAQRVKSTGERKIVNQVAVSYPKIAVQMHLRGTVKIVATVGPSGKVLSTELIGGSPVFVPNAVDAVTLMRWEPADKPTKEVVEVEFVPARR
jgi:outer membrane biosynthesis protein TonB